MNEKGKNKKKKEKKERRKRLFLAALRENEVFTIFEWTEDQVADLVLELCRGDVDGAWDVAAYEVVICDAEKPRMVKEAVKKAIRQQVFLQLLA